MLLLKYSPKPQATKTNKVFYNKNHYSSDRKDSVKIASTNYISNEKSNQKINNNQKNHSQSTKVHHKNQKIHQHHHNHQRTNQHLQNELELKYNNYLNHENNSSYSKNATKQITEKKSQKQISKTRPHTQQRGEVCKKNTNNNKQCMRNNSYFNANHNLVVENLNLLPKPQDGASANMQVYNFAESNECVSSKPPTGNLANQRHKSKQCQKHLANYDNQIKSSSNFYRNEPMDHLLDTPRINSSNKLIKKESKT